MHQAKKHKFAEIRDNPEYDDGIWEDIRKQIAKLNDNLSVRQESTGLYLRADTPNRL